MIEQRVTLRYGAQQIPAIVQAVQGDTGRDVIFELADYEIPTGATANYYIDKPDGNAVYNSAEVISSTEILAHLTEQALAEPGRNNGQVRILSDGDVITSFDFVLEVEVFRGILRLQSETEVNIFDQAIEDAVNTATEEAVAEIQAQTPAVTGMQNSIAPTYSAYSTYSVGDYVMYNAQLYKCNTAITAAEPWTVAHWTQMALSSDVRELYGAFRASNINIHWQNGYYIDSSGNYIPYSQFNATKKIPVYDATSCIKRNIYIRVRINTAAYIAFFDKDMNLISTETTPVTSGNPIYETDTDHVNGCHYVAVSCLANYSPIIKAIFTETDIGAVYDNSYHKENLFDPYDTRTQVGKYIDSTGRIIDIITDYAVSHPIKIKGGIQYTYQQPVSAFGSGAHYVVCDSYGNILANRAGLAIVNNTVTFTESESCYVMLNVSLKDTGRAYFKVCETEIFNTEYKPYIGKIAGKFICYNGDSIAESRFSGFPSNGGGYPYLIAKQTGGTYENKAVSGGTLSVSSAGHHVCETIANMSDNADLVCLEGGINDYWLHVPLGDYSESDFTGDVDNTTVCGALESIFRQAINKWVGVPIVFVIVHKITTTAWTVNNAGYTFAQEREKLIGICKKYSIPFVDMWAEGGLNAYMSVLDNAYLNGGGSVHPDGCHPDVNGYKKYYVSRLIDMFERVIPYE